AHPGDRLLPGRVDLQHGGGVGRVQRLAELGAEVPGAAEQVRLEDGVDPAPARHAARSAQHRGDLCGVVGVVVVDPDAADLTAQLEPAGAAGVGADALCGGLQAQACAAAHGHSGGGVERVVLARHAQLGGGAGVCAAEADLLAGACVGGLDLQVRVIGEAVGENVDAAGGQGVGRPLAQGPASGVVGT